MLSPSYPKMFYGWYNRRSSSSLVLGMKDNQTWTVARKIESMRVNCFPPSQCSSGLSASCWPSYDFSMKTFSLVKIEHTLLSLEKSVIAVVILNSSGYILSMNSSSSKSALLA